MATWRGPRLAALVFAILLLCGNAWGGNNSTSPTKPSAIKPSAADRSRFRIYNGKTNTKGYPWLISLWAYFGTTGWGHKCGATIIAPQWAVTAAHCVDDLTADHLLVVFGNTDLKKEAFQTSDVTKTIMHPTFRIVNQRIKGVDIALLRLKTTVKVQPIGLNTGKALEKVGSKVSLSGWGATRGPELNEKPAIYIFPTDLQEARMAVQSTSYCAKGSGATFDKTNYLCAGAGNGGNDACVGDSGSPIFRTNSSSTCQVGLVSFGPEYSCNKAYNRRRVGAYAKMSKAIQWIKSQGVSITTCK